MPSFSLAEILSHIAAPYTLQGTQGGRVVSSVKPAFEADAGSMVWIDPAREDKQQILERCAAGVVICDSSLKLPVGRDQLLIQVGDPKLTYLRVVSALFAPRPPRGVHPAAVIHPEAQIGDDVYIGPLSVIGKSSVGAGSFIQGSVHIYDGVSIGERVTIEAGCVIGVAGASLAKNEAGQYENFPHLGGVVIEDDVVIQAMVVIDRGVLADTMIGRGTVINSGCYVAHNCCVGANNFLAGHTMLSGSVSTGDNCWFGSGALVRDRVAIGADCFVGVGSVVVSSMGDGARVMGSPARPIDEAKHILRRLRQL